jgi:allophycocyanin-B
VYASCPGIEREGGALWPAFRAAACWRDMENFVRVVSYGCVVGDAPWLSADGCAVMARIYERLEVPTAAMCTGVRAARDHALGTVLAGAPAAERDAAARAFADLVAMMDALRAGEIDAWAAASPRCLRG